MTDQSSEEPASEKDEERNTEYIIILYLSHYGTLQCQLAHKNHIKAIKNTHQKTATNKQQKNKQTKNSNKQTAKKLTNKNHK